ncbi:Ivy family c-type lysozyme inhibitor [Burkholderia sp. BCC0405]|uniref:Ivy family c-type lysozyme inhibitor n=1 Tax=Burkholderia sp. BCC0405 TaxID=2676298 RepID=UPI0015883971|nr:Ivy family c-type lysozyme inhibitor [Burkholderia sp. BCC0405]
MRIKASWAIATIVLSVASASWAEKPALTVSTLKNDPAANVAFDAMKKGHALPEWATRGGTESPAHAVMLGGKRMLVMSACKPHACDSERMAVLYDQQKKVMYGVLSTVDPKKNVEQLTWMNIGDGDESIDGRTILYATLTGSVDNHPDAFNFK